MPTTDIEGALFGALRAVEDTPDPTAEANVNDLAFRLQAVRKLRSVLSEWDGMLTVALSEAMDEDRVTVPDVGTVVREPYKPKDTWDREGARTAIREAIFAEVALDPATGELRGDWRGVASRTIQKMAQAYSCLDPLVGGMKALGLVPNTYRTFEPTPGFNVKVLENLP